MSTSTPQPAASLDTLPDGAYVRAAQLITEPGRPGLLPFSGSTLWRKVKAETFPQPVKLSEGVTAWKLGDVRAWIAKQSQEGPASWLAKQYQGGQA